ncbi:MAG: PLP-dependent aminotransferase family protein [Pseudomonas sp.]
MRDLRIDRQVPEPVAQQIVTGVLDWIRQSRVRPGARLPSIRQLARDNQVSHSRVIEAYDRLVAEGILESRPGSGFFVAEQNTDGTAPDKELSDGVQRGWEQFTDKSASELNLGCGWVPESWREAEDIGFAIRQVTRSEMNSLFSYSTPLGLPLLRHHVQKRLELIDIQADPSQILTTQGASHAIDLLVRTLLKPGDCVVVESPGYYNLFNLLRLHGVTMLPVPRTRSGPDIEALEQLLLEHKPVCLFINSMYHNPTGTSLKPTVAHRLLQLAEIHDFKIVEDDTYADLQNDAATRLATLDSWHRVIYIASFSKTLSCSLRVGYIVANPALIGQLSEVKMITCMGASRFGESVVATLLANGAYRKLIQRLRERLSKHMASTLRLMEQVGWEVYAEPSGGMFIWARSGRHTFAQMQEVAVKVGVLLSPGRGYNPNKEESDWLRINVAYAGDQRASAFFNALALKPQASHLDPAEVMNMQPTAVSRI